MPQINIEVSEEEMEVLREQKAKLGVTWEEALIRGLAAGDTPLESLGIPDPLADFAEAAGRDKEFLQKLQNAQE